MKTLASLLLLWAASSLFADEPPSEQLETHSAEEVAIVEAYGPADLPQAEQQPGFGRFGNRENAVDTFLVIQKNTQSEDGRFMQHEHPLVLNLPAPSSSAEVYNVYLRILSWGAVASCHPVEVLGIDFGDHREELQLGFSEDEMLTLKGGTYHGEGRWKWVKILDSVKAETLASTKLQLTLTGGRGNYTGILISQIGYQENNPSK